MMLSSRRLVATRAATTARLVRTLSSEAGPALSYAGRTKDKSKYTLTQQEAPVRRNCTELYVWYAGIFLPLLLGATVSPLLSCLCDSLTLHILLSAVDSTNLENTDQMRWS